MLVLVVNAGSSSLKLSLVEYEQVVQTVTVERWQGEHQLEPIRKFLDQVALPGAVGHRVVHGGPRHRSSVRLDDRVLADIDAVAELAPLHNPRAASAIRAVAELLPDMPAVAAFDTSFHASIPRAAATYALPREWNHRYELRRYGFHGLSHAYAVRRAAEILQRPLHDLRVVSCHLGAGASVCAVRDGRSVDTTMGFTPLEGLVMKTRSGSLDPGLLLWLLEQPDIDPATLGQVLEQQSGLKGLSGTSGDLRDVLDAHSAGDADAALAFEVMIHRLVLGIGAMTAAARGIDVLVFTGGMGEHSPELRAAAAARVAHLGVEVDADANQATTDADVSAQRARVRTLVVSAQEDLQVAREVRRILG